MNTRHSIHERLFHLLLVTTVAVAAAAAAGSAEAQELCIEEAAGQTLNCTANDVSIALLIVEEIVDPCDFEGDTAQVVLRAEVSAGANERFDVGFYVATDGGDARTGECVRGLLAPPGTPVDPNSGFGPYPDLDGDACGDVTQNEVFLRDVLDGSPVTITCTRSAENPALVEINSCVSWDHQASSTDCSGVDDTFPSNKSKCSCSTLTIDVPIPPAPSISVVKTPPSQTVTSGDPAVFTLEVENIGNTVLDNVSVVDDPPCDTLSAPTCAGDGGADDDLTLSEGESCTYTCTVNDVTADFTNTVTVTADDPADTQVSDVATASVIVETPAIAIVKGPATQEVVQGGSADFTVEVENTGETAYDGTTGGNMTLTDDHCTLALVDCAGDLGADDDATFSPGEVCSYTCTVDDVQADFTNTATVSIAEPALGPVQDSAEVTVAEPGGLTAIAIRKVAVTPQVQPGDDAEFTIEVENTGDLPFDGTAGGNMTLTDDFCTPILVDCTGDGNADDDATFSPGEVCTYTCTVNDVQAGFTNTATVALTEPALGPFEADAAVSVALSLIDIPTLSQWGLIGLALLLLGAGWTVLRR